MTDGLSEFERDRQVGQNLSTPGFDAPAVPEPPVADEDDALDVAPELQAARPLSAVAVALHLSWMRSTYLTAKALAERFPEPHHWQACLDDPAFHEQIAQFAGIVSEVRDVAFAGQAVHPSDLAALEDLGMRHRAGALASLERLADQLRVSPDDLIVALIHA